MGYKIDTVLKTVNGGIKIPDKIRDAFNLLIEKSDKRHGGYLRMTLALPYKKRTTGKHSQNAHLNGHIQQICNETGENFDVVKMHVKRVALKYGYPCYTDIFGEVEPKSESETSTEECAFAIEASHEVAAFLSVELIEE